MNNDKTNIYIEWKIESHALKCIEPSPRDNNILIKTDVSIQCALLTLITSFQWDYGRTVGISFINGTRLVDSPNFKWSLDL